MGTRASVPAFRVPSGSSSVVAAAVDRLAELDSIVAGVAEKDRESAERSAHVLEDQEKFLAAFHNVCEGEVRPAMQAVLERLQHAGGGGVIEEHQGGEPRFPEPGFTLWMSLKGEIVGGPRPDRHPYLQLEADVARRQVQVSEGDIWRGAGGGRSGRIGVWQLSELTSDRVIQELVAIARRAAG